jgi:hypothetical protein
MIMKTFSKVFSSALISITLTTVAFAQDDDAIYGDIYETPAVEEITSDSVSPLDGYSTVDDYYPEGGYSAQRTTEADRPYSEQYVDENGNTVINNYYGDYYEDDNNFDYSARINRFHRNNWGWSYYDPFYTNMYYYTYDPFYWGTSIYVGYWPSYSWGWNSWGWNDGWGWNNGWGWNSPYYSPACYGGWNYGWGGSYWNGYNNGYWNGFNDGLAHGGYYNTYDGYSGIYYGPRGSSGNSGGVGSGYRNSSFASVYNQAAKEGKVHHANLNNVLQTADAREVKGSPTNRIDRPNGTDSRTLSTTKESNVAERAGNSTQSVSRNAEGNDASNNVRSNTYQRPSTDRTQAVRQQPVTVDRSRERTTTTQSRTTVNPNLRNNAYQRGNTATRYPSQQYGQPSRNNSGVRYQDGQRSNSQNGYQRPSSNPNRYTQPSRSGTDTRTNQYYRPSNQQQVPSRNYTPPARSNTPSMTQPSAPARTQPSTPSRTAPSRSSQPQKSVTPPSRGTSGGSSYSAPSRSSGTQGSSGFSAPSRSSNSGSKRGRP